MDGDPTEPVASHQGKSLQPRLLPDSSPQRVLRQGEEQTLGRGLEVGEGQLLFPPLSTS